jgi:glycosyltransferase involved in cell wall biosynthesis
MTQPAPSTTHLVLIPSYNPGPRLLSTARAALARWAPVWVITDGSTDGSTAEILKLAATEPNLHVIVRPVNGGKGAAVLTASAAALAAGFTHALVLDADGQHPEERIPDFMAASRARPSALIIGQPIFGPEAPAVRLYGRKLSIGLVHFATLGRVIADPLFGFRVYPLAPLVAALHSTRFARRYDFDPEVAVRMIWAGTPVQNLPATCRYLTKSEGGISHFHYLRDNLRMIWLHTRLITELIFRFPSILRLRGSAR